MRYYIIIPAHNEEKFIGLTLQSLAEQTILPSKIVVVNDNSTDKTAEIIQDFAKNNTNITIVNKLSEPILVIDDISDTKIKAYYIWQYK